MVKWKRKAVGSCMGKTGERLESSYLRRGNGFRCAVPTLLQVKQSLVVFASFHILIGKV